MFSFFKKDKDKDKDIVFKKNCNNAYSEHLGKKPGDLSDKDETTSDKNGTTIDDTFCKNRDPNIIKNYITKENVIKAGKNAIVFNLGKYLNDEKEYDEK